MLSKTYVVLFGAVMAAGAAVANTPFTVNKVVGTVLSSQDGVTVPVKPGMVLVDGQTLTTAARSSLQITLKSGCSFTIQPSTTFVVNSSVPCNVAMAQSGSVRLAQGGPAILINPINPTFGGGGGLFGGLGGLGGGLGAAIGMVGVPSLGRVVENNVYGPVSP